MRVDVKLGKTPATPARVRPMREMLGLRGRLRLAVPVPAMIDRSGAVESWGMLANGPDPKCPQLPQGCGDCTIAAVGHAVELWSAETGTARAMTDAEAIAGYEMFGFRPGDESTDQGANVQDVLTHWTVPGFAVGGAVDKLAGFCAINAALEEEVKAGVAWLGNVYVGLMLPLACQEMIDADVWDVPQGCDFTGAWEPGSWGGHAVNDCGFSPNDTTIVTWGKPKLLTWPFWHAYVDEAYGLLSKDFASNRIAAQQWNELEAEMAALRAEAA